MKFTSLFVPAAALAVSLWMFVIYRSEHSVVNVLLGNVLPPGILRSLREAIAGWVPLPESMVYRLPGGLWVFAATLIAKNGHVMLHRFKVNLAQLPVIVAVGLELLQKFVITDGAYDPGDIAVALVASFAAGRLMGCAWPPLDLSRGWHWRGALCLGSYAILFLADINR